MKMNDDVQSDYFVLNDEGCFLRSLTKKEAADLKAAGTPIEEAAPDAIGLLAAISRRVMASLFNQAHSLSRK